MKLTLRSVFLSIFIVSSCGFFKGTLDYTEHTNFNSGAIPPNFNGDSLTTIFHLTGLRGRDKVFKKIVAEEYNGRYVFASGDDIERMMKDSLTYGYVFSNCYNNLGGQMVVNSHTYEGSDNLRMYKFFVYDLNLKKGYGPDVSSSFFKEYLTAYIRNLELSRIEK